MAYSGPYPVTFSGVTSAMVVDATAFSGSVINTGSIGAGGIQVSASTLSTGGITNAGTISPTGAGIHVVSSTIHGAIVDSGAILSGLEGILIGSGSVVSGGVKVGSHGKLLQQHTGIRVINPYFAGGILNAGTVSASFLAIAVANVSTFAGGISNSGLLSASVGIRVASVGLFGSASAGNGISNGGTIIGSLNGIVVDSVTLFEAGIVNSGKISGGNGVNVTSAGTFAAGINNSGTIAALSTGIRVISPSQFDGGISNSGTISAALMGVQVTSATKFDGGIVNRGAVTAASIGILVQQSTSFSGGILNKGRISAGEGILALTDGSFSGASTGAAISNAGTISAATNGIQVISALQVAGGIVNSGTIRAGNSGIEIDAVTTFVGNLVNSGHISGGVIGMGVGYYHSATSASPVATFTGSVIDTGLIVAQTGIRIFGSTIGGAIVDSGTISGSSRGIVVDGAAVAGGITVAAQGKVSAGPQAIEVEHATTFNGNIVNAGRVTAITTGIRVLQAGFFGGSIVNRGQVSAEYGIGATSVAQFVGSGAAVGIVNSGTISSLFTGIYLFNDASFGATVVNSGTIRAGRAAIAIYDSTITAGIVVAGSITGKQEAILVDPQSKIVGSPSVIPIRINGPTFAGGLVNYGTIVGPGPAIIVSGAHGVNVFDAGTISGGAVAVKLDTASNSFTLGAGYDVIGEVVASHGGAFQLGGSALANFDLGTVGTQYVGFTAFNVVGGDWLISGSGSGWNVDSAILQVASGAVLSNTTVRPGGLELLGSGGTDNGLVISSGGFVSVGSGSTVEGAVVKKGGFEGLFVGDTVSGIVSAGGVLGLAGNATTGGMTLETGAILQLGLGAVGSSNVSAAHPIQVISGGTQNGGTVLSSGSLTVLNSGVASGVTVGSGGTETISSGGYDFGATVSSGGRLVVASGGVAQNLNVSRGGAATVAQFGTVKITFGMTDRIDGTLNNSGIVQIDDNGLLILAGTVHNSGQLFAYGAGGVLEVANGATVSGGSAVIENGTIEFQGSGNENVKFFSRGAGSLFLDQPGHAYTGKISGFGGVNGSNTSQSIVFFAVSSGANVSAVYVSSASHLSGSLEIKSGGSVVAQVTLVGDYSSASFQLAARPLGGLVVTDPPAVSGQNSANAGLFGHYIAGSLVGSGNPAGGTAVSNDVAADPPRLLAPHP